jgi:hypothetical protein
MLPVISAWLALFSSLFRSRWALLLQVLVLQHQVAVYQQTIARPRLSPTAPSLVTCGPSFWGTLPMTRSPGGARP